MDDRLLGVEPRHLAALVAVGQEGSLKAAAERLRYVRSAVSQQIAHLERNVGTPLVERLSGVTAVELTPAGRRLAEHAEVVIAQLDAAAADLRALAAGRDELRVGTARRGAATLLLSALADMERSGAAVPVTVHERGSVAEQDQALSRGEIDVAFADLPIAGGPFAWRELVADPVTLLVRRDAPLAAGGRGASLLDLASLPLLVPSAEIAQLVEARLRAEGLEPRSLSVYDMSAGVQALVGAGLGAALMPRLAVDDADASVVALSLGGVLPPRRLALYWHEGRRHVPGLAAFSAAATRAAERLGRHERESERSRERPGLAIAA